MNLKDSIVKNSGLIIESKVSQKSVVMDMLIKAGATDKGDTESLNALYKEVMAEIKQNPKLSIAQAVKKIC